MAEPITQPGDADVEVGQFLRRSIAAGGRGGAKPLSNFNLDGDLLPPLTCASLYVLTAEAARFANATAEQGLRADLVRANAEVIDATFLDPANVGVPDETPASVTAGVTPIASAGSPAEDLAALIAAFTGDLAAASLVTDPTTATRIALARDAAGEFLFPDCGPRGGSVLGLPLVVSRSSPRDSSGGILAPFDGSGIAYGAEGVRSVVSNEASLEVADDPTSSSSTPTESTQVSLFQTHSVAILSEVAVNWKVIRPGSVAYVADADYPGGGVMSFDAKKFVGGLHDYLDKAFAPLVARVKALEDRKVKSLADAYRGTWQPGNSYQRGSLATHQGSLWIALVDTGDKPGSSSDWRLCVKGQA